MLPLGKVKASNSPYMQYYFKRFFVLHSSEVMFSFLIKKVKAKSSRNRNCIEIKDGEKNEALLKLSGQIIHERSKIKKINRWIKRRNQEKL